PQANRRAAWRRVGRLPPSSTDGGSPGARAGEGGQESRGARHWSGSASGGAALPGSGVGEGGSADAGQREAPPQAGGRDEARRGAARAHSLPQRAGESVTDRKSSVKVSIVGEEYTIRSDAPPEHTRAVAAYVDAAIRSVMNAGAVVETHKAAILAALQITDELFRSGAASAELAGELQELGSEAKRWLPPAKRTGKTAG